MLDPNDKTEIAEMIDFRTKQTYNKRIGDTPTDNLQLVPKQYMTSYVGAYVSGSIAGYIATKFKCLFDHYASQGNVTTAETDLYNDSIAAGTLSNNGDKLEAQYGGTFVSSGTATRDVRLYFGGGSVFDSGALTLSLSSAWTLYVTLIRLSSNTVRYMVSMTTEGAALAAYTATGELIGPVLANANNLQLTGQASGVGAATNDIVAKLGTIYFVAAA